MVQGNNFNHLGGIAVGGGMLEGLGSLLFKNAQGQEINEFATQGSREKLDLLIGDVVNKIGTLSPEITAVNFGKARLFQQIQWKIHLQLYVIWLVKSLEPLRT